MVTMDACNFSKAADKLCITRSPLTKVIGEMEEDLGGLLFERRYNNLEPTELAYSWSAKIKPLYVELVKLESLMKRNHHDNIDILYDASIPELLYRYIDSALSFENIPFTSKRKIINNEEVFIQGKTIADMIISLRDITPLPLTMKLDKWDGGQIGFLMPEVWDLDGDCPYIYVWEDSYSEYIKGKISDHLRDCSMDYQFMTHNHEPSTLLNQIHKGKGMVVLPEKLAALYNSNGVKFLLIKNRKLRFHFYYDSLHNEYGVHKRIKDIIKSII